MYIVSFPWTEIPTELLGIFQNKNATFKVWGGLMTFCCITFFEMDSATLVAVPSGLFSNHKQLHCSKKKLPTT